MYIITNPRGMATKLVVFLNQLLTWLFPISYPFIADIYVTAQGPDPIIFYVMLIYLFSLEPLLFYRPFREWVTLGNDMKDTITRYTTFWMLRIFVFMTVGSLVYGWEIDNFLQYATLGAATGIQGFAEIRKFYSQNENRN